jgi:hypothetical protein
MATTTRKFTTAEQKPLFNWDTYNAVMKDANSGLKLFLAEQMLLDVQEIMVRFKSPLRNDMTSIVDELAQLRADNKKYLASRERSANETIDNPVESASHSTSADSGRVSGIQNLPEAPL